MTRAARQRLTRDRLLDAAAQLFAQRGLTASLDDVAAAAGLTKGAVYSNFANKEALLVALVKRRIEGHEAPDRSGPLWDRQIPLRDRLNDLARWFEVGMAEDSTRGFLLFTVEFWAAAMRNERIKEAYAEAVRHLRNGFTAQLEERIAGATERTETRSATAPTETAPLPARELAAIAIAIDIGLGIQRIADPEAIPGHYYADAVRLLLGPLLGEDRGNAEQ